MAKRKTRIVREGKNKSGRKSAPVSASRIDLDAVKARYAGRALPEDELYEEYDQEEYAGDGQAHSRVMDGEQELNIFGEDDEYEYDERPRISGKLLAAFFGALIVTVCLGLYFLLIVDNITVGGNAALEKGEVLTIAGLNPGEHLWFADIGGAKARLMADPMIKEATVKRVYPNTISIMITERSRVAAIVSGGTVAIIDGDGRVMEISSQVPEGMAEVYGVSSSGFTAGQDLSADPHFNADALLEILSALSHQDILGIIDYIDMSQPLKIEMNTVYGIHINVGQAENITEKLEPLSAVISKVMEMGYQGGTVDLAVLGDPVYSPPQTAEPEPEETPVPQETPDAGTGQAPEGAEPAATPIPQTTPLPTPAAGGNGGNPGFSG